jgi:hypothetical protein
MVSRLDLAVVFAAMAGMAVGIEHGHHISTDVPTTTKLSALAAATECPDNGTLPYPASCLVFMEGKIASEMRRPIAAQRAPAARPSAAKPGESTAPGVACPDNDNTPYSASCLAFLSGWFWRPDALQMQPGPVRLR